MDLVETMKTIVAKGMQTEMGPPGGGSGYPAAASGAGYITEKMYSLLQCYLTNKGWNQSIELLQYLTEMKEASMVPSPAYLQMVAQRVAMDSQGRLVLRENGKIILPFEHFANAVMIKHMNGPHGMHVTLEGTVRAVMESYTIGRECFGMEKEFIVEVVQNCPNEACRFYKNQLELTQKIGSMRPTYIQDNETTASLLRSSFPHSSDLQALSGPNQNTLMGGQGADFSEMRSSVNPMIQRPPSRPSLNIPHRPGPQEKKQASKHYEPLIPNIPITETHKLSDFLRTNLENIEGIGAIGLGNSNKDLLALHNGAWPLSESDSNFRSSAAISEGGQEKIVRGFQEMMKNIYKMKTCVRPSMCKPYGKQSEALQKTLVDTIQLVQSLRSFLPPPHIPVSSWKNEDKHRLDHSTIQYLPSLKAGLDDICEQRKRD